MARRWGSLIAAALACVLGASVPRASSPGALVLRNVRVLTVSGPEIPDGMIVIEGGRLTGVGRNLPIPAGAVVVDGGGGVATPGLVNAHVSLSELEEGGGGGADELSDPNSAALQVLDGLNPFDKRIVRLRRAGTTAALVTPGRANVIGGQVAVVRFSGTTASEMSVLAPAGIKFSLGEGPKGAFGGKGRLPSTRMGAAFVVRKALLDATEYRRKWAAYRAKAEARPEPAAKRKTPAGAAAPESPVPPARDLGLEALAGLLDGKYPAFVECYRVDDIMTALRLIDEFQIKAVLIGATEGGLVAPEIARRHVPVIVGPVGVGPRRMETQEADLGVASALANAGVAIALQGEGAMGIGATEELTMVAALAMKGGLARDAALKAITLSAAQIVGVGDRLGSLEPGRIADIAVFSGDPLSYTSRVTMVIVGGAVVQ